jgi:aminomethyltransferase
LEVHWPEIESLYKAVNLTPKLAGRASRSSVPVYGPAGQIGQATSHTFSPLLKKYIALATIHREHATPGTQLKLELTVEFVRHPVTATVVKLPFFDPERKRK